MTTLEYVLLYALAITNTLWFMVFKAFYKEVKKRVEQSKWNTN